jgi:hypothetical protein
MGSTMVNKHGAVVVCKLKEICINDSFLQEPLALTIYHIHNDVQEQPY